MSVSSTSHPWGEGALYHFDKIGANKAHISRVITFGAICGGAVAGILGLEGLAGFVFYLFMYTLIVAALFARLVQPTAYLRSVAEMGDLGCVVDGLLTYILVWTITYDSIYIF
eukprot:PhM_4_TR3998/c0_g1_i1/m.86752